MCVLGCFIFIFCIYSEYCYEDVGYCVCVGRVVLLIEVFCLIK